MASSPSAPPHAGGALVVRPPSKPDHSRAERTSSAAGVLAFCLTFIVAVFVVAALLAFAPAAAAPQHREPVRAQVTADVSGGYARIVFALSDEVDATVHSAGNILIINFDRPVYLAVEHLVTHASQYIAAARRDPDGRSVRFALAHKVNVNSIQTADKFFVDLLPETWQGPPPPLPHEVVEELARRAREAEHLQHMARLAEERRRAAPVRVHVASHPTFTRYVFDIP
jgi:hypothetical protein